MSNTSKDTNVEYQQRHEYYHINQDLEISAAISLAKVLDVLASFRYEKIFFYFFSTHCPKL